MISSPSVPKVKPIVRILDEKVLATKRLSLVYFSFLFFNTSDKRKSEILNIKPYILMMNKIIPKSRYVKTEPSYARVKSNLEFQIIKASIPRSKLRMKMIVRCFLVLMAFSSFCFSFIMLYFDVLSSMDGCKSNQYYG